MTRINKELKQTKRIVLRHVGMIIKLRYCMLLRHSSMLIGVVSRACLLKAGIHLSCFILFRCYLYLYKIPPSSGSRGGGVRGFNPPPLRGFFLFCLSVYENPHGPGP